MQYISSGAFWIDGKLVPAAECVRDRAEGARATMAHAILTAHNTSGDEKKLKLRFDAMASHDITYVGIIQSARASGLTEFPMPYVLTNCHKLPLRGGRNYQRGRPRFRPFGCQKIRRNLRSRPSVGHPRLYA